MTTISLEDIPKSPHEVEDYVAALFQCARYFVEKNLIEKDFTEVLELDAVATSYEGQVPSSVLAEAKSGNWGFPDLFKIAGWLQYLSIQKGAVFVVKDIADMDPASVNAKIALLNVTLVKLGDFTAAIPRFKAAGFGDVSDPISLSVWRFSYWVERQLIVSLRQIAKADPAKKGPSAAVQYYRLINNEVFFVKGLGERLSGLYAAYKSHPKLSLGVAIELDGGTFDPDAVDPENARIRNAYLKGKDTVLQSCFYLEHRGRLAILKAAIDYLAMAGTGNQPPLQGLPASFSSGLKWLQESPSFRRYAVFWQVLLWGFGGFFLEDRKATEFAWLYEQTGVPVDEIPRALEAFDRLFPLPNGQWIAQAGKTQCKIVKLVPPVFRGLGAWQRRTRYNLGGYAAFGYSDFTGKDLATWNNLTVELLK